MLKQNKECVSEQTATVSFTRVDISEITFSLYDGLATSMIYEIFAY